MSAPDIQFCRSLPKVELHAHLNGSLSVETVKKLGEYHESLGRNIAAFQEFDYENMNLDTCFKLFPLAQALTIDKESVKNATKCTIEEFADDGCVHLELRSTPRCTDFMTQAEYLQAIIEAVEESKNIPITVKIIASIDRRMELNDALGVVALTKDLRDKYEDILVGIDLSGDPRCRSFNYFIPALDQARTHGMKTSIHCAEVPNNAEVLEILQWHPDRLGHAVCIHPDYEGTTELWEVFIESKIPVEACLSSNVWTKSISSYDNHHVRLLQKAEHPFVICTDDKGVFNTTLSQEYYHLSKMLALSEDDLTQIAADALQFCFEGKNKNG